MTPDDAHAVGRPASVRPGWLRVARVIGTLQALSALAFALLGAFVAAVSHHDDLRDRAQGNTESWDGFGTAVGLVAVVAGGALALAYGIPALRLRPARTRARAALMAAEAFTAAVLLAIAPRAWSNPAGPLIWLVVAASTAVALLALVRAVEPGVGPAPTSSAQDRATLG